MKLNARSFKYTNNFNRLKTSKVVEVSNKIRQQHMAVTRILQTAKPTVNYIELKSYILLSQKNKKWYL